MRSNLKHPLPLDVFKELAGIRQPNSITLYLPMFKQGKEQNLEMGPATLKTQIHQLEKTLNQHGLSDQKIADYLAPLKGLVAERELWRNPSDGLVVFLNEDQGLQYYQLPIGLDAFSYVGDHFYMLPLLSLYDVDGMYYILELSRDYVKLYQADRFGLQDLFVETHAPELIEEVVGYDYEQKTMQFRTGQAGYQGTYHGHGEGKDDEKKELIKFFREIDKGVNKLAETNTAPLLIAGVTRWYSLYRDANTYPTLYKDPLIGDPEFKNKGQMHKESWKLMAPFFGQAREESISKYRDHAHLDTTSHQISDIVPAAENGRVAALFIRKGADVYGTFGPKKCLILDSEKTAINSSIVNKVALDTFMQGGKVYLLREDEMPYPKRPINALYRY